MQFLFQRILLSMDLSGMDEKILAFTAKLNAYSSASNLYLTHIIPDFNTPENEDLKFHKLFTTSYPVDEKVKDILTERANDYFDNRSIQIDVNVLEGKPYKKLLHWIEVKEIDLVVFGHKNKSEGSGITAKRMARNANTNVLFVPEKVSDKIQHIFVPLDFSTFSAKALKQAIALKNRIGVNARVTILHVLKMMASDYYYGLDLNNKYQDLLKENGQKRLDQFLKSENIAAEDFNVMLLTDHRQNVATTINQVVTEQNPDLVIMGSKGHSTIENFLFGSVTEQFSNICTTCPVLIVR